MGKRGGRKRKRNSQQQATDSSSSSSSTPESPSIRVSYWNLDDDTAEEPVACNDKDDKDNTNTTSATTNITKEHFSSTTNTIPHGLSSSAWAAWKDAWLGLKLPEPSAFQLQVWNSWCCQQQQQQQPKQQQPKQTNHLHQHHQVVALQLQAPTGSGKTIAYGLPLMASTNNRFVLVPTRELCRQVAHECERMIISKTTGTTTPAVHAWYGGAVTPKQTQWKQALESRTGRTIVTTPGRLCDMLLPQPDNDDNNHDDQQEEDFQRRRRQLLGDASVTLVLDEADRLASHTDLAEQVDRIVKALQPRHWIFCSATETVAARETWKSWLRTHVHASHPRVCVIRHVVAPTSTTTSTVASPPTTAIPAQITQIVHVCAQHKKARKLVHILQQKVAGRPGLVFFATIKTLQYVGQLLRKSLGSMNSIVIMEYHSRMPQRQRERPLQGIVLTTDLCARGIHWNAAEWVIQYDFPGNLETYIHRCGRVGRQNQTQMQAQSQQPQQHNNNNHNFVVYSFFTRNLQAMAPDLIQLLRATNQWIDPNLQGLVVVDSIKKKAKRKTMDDNNDNDNDDDTFQQPNEEDLYQDDDDRVFAALAADRIVLKKASHVSDASSSEDEDSDPQDDDDDT